MTIKFKVGDKIHIGIPIGIGSPDNCSDRIWWIEDGKLNWCFCSFVTEIEVIEK